MAINLTNPRISRFSNSIVSTYSRISSVNFNEDGTLRVDVDFYNVEQDFLDGNSPLDSAQYTVAALPAVENTIQASLLAETDINL